HAEHFRFHALFEGKGFKTEYADRMGDLIQECHRRLDAFEATGARVAGIIGYWDFPVTSVVPLLCRQRDLPGPDLDSVTRCTHKYWSRLEQQECVPECTPRFQVIDPFEKGIDHAIELDYPFWIKPIKAYGSGLGFRIEDHEQLLHALDRIRERIGSIGNPYEDLLRRMHTPEHIMRVGGKACLIEEIVKGREIAPEGWVHRGRITINGIIDMPRVRGSFDRYEYPAQISDALRERIEDASRRIIHHFAFDNGCFNIEFFYDDELDRLSVIEVNPRISQSHSYLFNTVDGMSNHELAVKIAVDQDPEFEHLNGPYGAAAKGHFRIYEDGLVHEVPTAAELEAIKQDFPDCEVAIPVEPGSTLSDLPDQDSYSYCVAEIHVCGRDHDDMLERYEQIKQRLRFVIESVHNGQHVWSTA
ncbi:MAG: ATP-grasp domain-containing protein, partial [Planctomycetota bacterium]